MRVEEPDGIVVIQLAIDDVVRELSELVLEARIVTLTHTSSNTTLAATVRMPMFHRAMMLSFRCGRSSWENVAFVAESGIWLSQSGTFLITASNEPEPSFRTRWRSCLALLPSMLMPIDTWERFFQIYFCTFVV